MKSYRITGKLIRTFQLHLMEQERSPGTIQNYLRALRQFYHTLQNPAQVTKQEVIRFKEQLISRRSPSTVNVALAALNSFFRFAGYEELRVKSLKRQQQIFCNKERELSKPEYLKLLHTARSRGNQRLLLIMETICSTGIRVSELQYITVDAVRRGQAEVRCKGKLRAIFLSGALKQKLLCYLRTKKIHSGPVFVTKSGRPVDRSNIWSEMKALCRLAGISAQKVFPHNLRHLFARTFYTAEKDLSKLADLLGHVSVETTRLYIKESGAEHRRRIEQLGLLL